MCWKHPPNPQSNRLKELSQKADKAIKEALSKPPNLEILERVRRASVIVPKNRKKESK